MSEKDKVRYCGKCGYTLVNGVCPVCKNKQRDPKSMNGNQGGGAVKIIVIIAVAIIAIGGIIAGILLSGSSDDVENTAESSYSSSDSSPNESSSAAQATKSNKADKMYDWITAVINDGPYCWENPDNSSYVILSNPRMEGDDVYVTVEWWYDYHTGRIIEQDGGYAIYFEYEEKGSLYKVWITIEHRYTYDDSYGEICWDYGSLTLGREYDGDIFYETLSGNYIGGE